MRWVGKGADKRLDPFKFALSWATGRHAERVPVNYLHGIPRFYEGADRAEIIWEDAEVDLFCSRAPELHADAVRLARETGLRIGDLVELERSEIKKAPDGSRAIILRPNKRRRRIVNMPLTAAVEAIIDKAPISRRLILKPMRADAWDPPRLSREVREYATEFEIRRELRFNDLRGTKITEMVWSGISVPDFAIRVGWKIETAAKMLGVYAALNPGRATVVPLPAPVRPHGTIQVRRPPALPTRRRHPAAIPLAAPCVLQWRLCQGQAEGYAQGAAATKRSRSSSVPTPRRGSRFCRVDGSSSEHLRGSGDAAG
jgi:hypothetical protein